MKPGDIVAMHRIREEGFDMAAGTRRVPLAKFPVYAVVTDSRYGLKFDWVHPETHNVHPWGIRDRHVDFIEVLEEA